MDSKSRVFNLVALDLQGLGLIETKHPSLKAMAKIIAARNKPSGSTATKKGCWKVVIRYASARGLIPPLPVAQQNPPREKKAKPAKLPKASKKTKRAKSKAEFDAFYQTREWRKLRFAALLKYGRKCMCCYATDKVMHVDHVKPRSKFPELELELSNLQILCEDCNMGKGGWSQADFRESESATIPTRLN
jgi:5-methylcytosine-specific restriction endonuclease McrA